MYINNYVYNIFDISKVAYQMLIFQNRWYIYLLYSNCWNIIFDMQSLWYMSLYINECVAYFLYAKNRLYIKGLTCWFAGHTHTHTHTHTHMRTHTHTHTHGKRKHLPTTPSTNLPHSPSRPPTTKNLADSTIRVVYSKNIKIVNPRI